MKNFRVYATMTELLFIDIKANNLEEAIAIAEETDGGDFISGECQNGTWEINPELTEELFLTKVN